MKIDGWLNDSGEKEPDYRRKKKREKRNLPKFENFNKKSAVKIVVVLVLIFAVWNHFRYYSEIGHMMDYIEARQYAIAIDYYSSLEKEFSESKMDSFNAKLSKKINKFLENTGNDFFNGSISKEQFTGFVNMVNSLDRITIKNEHLLDQCKKATDMYSNDDISYETAKSFVDSISALQGMEVGTEEYRQEIESIYDSRMLYERGREYQNKFQYEKAIENYEKVLERDKKYYKKAEDNKKECIEKMYDYYLQEAYSAAKVGNYELATEYVEYVKKYYPDDEKVEKVLKDYQKKLDEYTLGSEDIKNIYCKKTETEPEGITISPLPQMVNGEKYYYAEILKDGKRINEVLINAENKKLYLYKDGERSYKSKDGLNFFRLNTNGQIEFAISEKDATENLKTELEKNKRVYKKLETMEVDKADRYSKSDKKISELLDKKENTYFFFIGNKGFLRGKDLYCVDMYSGIVYSFEDNKLVRI